MGNYESKKRTKPCAACKRQKLKCIYGSSLPCERCIRQGIPCSYPELIKTKSPFKNTGTNIRQHPGQTVQSSQPPTKSFSLIPSTTFQDTVSSVSGYTNQSDPISNENYRFQSQVTQNVDQRLDSLQNTLNSVITIFKKDKAETSQQLELLQSQIIRLQQDNSIKISSGVSLPSLSEIISHEQTSHTITDFRINNLITPNEAAELLDIFITKMSTHMFGYKMNQMSAHELWNRSPILLVSICSVACRHHPTLAGRQEQLIASLQWFTSQLINTDDYFAPSEDIKRTILALIIASLWFESNRLYLSIALQLARTWKIDEECTDERNGDNWKLWYLLYIADGAQNLLCQKSPSIYKESEPMLLSAREHLINRIKNERLKQFLRENISIGKDGIATNKQLFLLNEVEHNKILLDSAQLQDIRLCGLVEYHMAIESIFHRKNFSVDSLEAVKSLLEPSRFGIPWRNNMDLDRWMVSWTITLQNIDVQNDAWCLKSTLLYYNFARMHMNTEWLLDRKVNLNKESRGKSNWIEVWKSVEPTQFSDLRAASDEISSSAARNLLKLATKDRDICSMFQFLPNHIYLMLFYASVIVLKRPPPFNASKTDYVKKLQKDFNLVKAFRDSIASGTTSDIELTRKIVEGTDSLMRLFIDHCVNVSNSRKTSSSSIAEIIQNGDLITPSDTKRKTISAWPGVNHGHPSGRNEILM